MLQKEIELRKIPQTLPEGLQKENWNEYRKEMIALFAREEYGVTPEAPKEVRAEVEKQYYDWGSKHEHRKVTLSFDAPLGEASFPFDLTIPYAKRPAPLFISINFYDYPGGLYCPMEEICDHGYAVAAFNYNNVTKDEDDGFSTGIAKMYPRRNDGTDWGKIGMWAFAASRIMDYVSTLPEIDASRVYVIGHSRLGKTAIWCAVQDERIAGAVSNDSGCSGAAVTRGKEGEHIHQITGMFPHWFCENYKNYANNEDQLPFDQHQLLSLIAPRLLCVGSGTLDTWADPNSEFLSACLASDAYRLLGEKGLVCEAEPQAGEDHFEGRLGHHLRYGTHHLNRDDWNAYIRFFDMHTGE